MQAEKGTAADFQQFVEQIELPEPQGGRRVFVTVRSVDSEHLAAELKGVPVVPAPDQEQEPETEEEKQRKTEEATRQGFSLMRVLAIHGIVEPAFCFGDAAEPGKAWWGSVTMTNRTAIMNAIMRLSGIGAAGPLGTFRGEPGGDGTGSSAGRAVEETAERVA